jgi:hypothetical protein
MHTLEAYSGDIKFWPIRPNMSENNKLYGPSERVALAASYSRELRDAAWHSKTLFLFRDNQRVVHTFIQYVLSVIDYEYVSGVIR